MKGVLERLERFRKDELTFKTLGEELLKVDFTTLDYKNLLPKVESQNNYARNILCLEPLEVVLLVWPPGTESAIHFHEGFFGYVAVLEGTLDNIEYLFSDGQLKESMGMKGLPGGLLAEPDNVIHKLVNLSTTTTAVTAHFYYPALDNLTGIKIYDVERGRIGTLNNKAQTASWLESEDHFSEIQENAFEYLPYQEYKKASHRIYPIIPKPDSSLIARGISNYYCEQADTYDFFDLKHESRRKYTDRVNDIIAEEVAKDQIHSMLTLACGTGRRAIDIQEKAGTNYDITGVDISPEMTSIAKERGIKAVCSNWVDAELGETQYDAATFLYAFGHIPTREERLRSLSKINQHLKKGGELFLDVFNVNDKNEWGPHAVKAFDVKRFGEFGYQRGDVFYKKVTGKEIAFLHYFEEEELINDLKESGFSIDFVKHIGYVKKSGEILDQPDEGSLLIKAIAN